MPIKKLKYKKIDNKKYFLNNQYSEELQSLFKKINLEIRHKYSIQTVNRDFIIKSLIQALTQGDLDRKKILNIDFIVIRLDIKSFFPSINKHKLYQKISYSNLLSFESMDIIKQVTFSNYYHGIPIGLPFSSSLAELALEDFDSDIKSKINPLFYFRFVDDILLFISPVDSELDIINKKLDEIFTRYGFSFNKKRASIKSKSQLKRGSWSFEFLGYCFKKDENSDYLTIDIASNKIDKIKNKIHYYYRDFCKNQNFWLLHYRIKELFYSNTSLKDGKKFRYGFAYSYRFINTSASINNIRNFLYTILNQTSLTNRQKMKIISLVPKNCQALSQYQFNYTRASNKQLDNIIKQLGIGNYSFKLSKFEKIKLITSTLYS